MYITNLIFFFRKNFTILVLILLFLSINNFFYNLYSVYMRDHEERKIMSYGYCNKTSYGFINHIKKNYLSDGTVTIINFELNPPSIGLFHDLRPDENNDELILLNFNINKKYILTNKKINLMDFKLVNSIDNCHYYKKK